MHYTNNLQLSENKTHALHKYLTADNKTCTTELSYSQQRIKHALHKYLTVSKE